MHIIRLIKPAAHRRGAAGFWPVIIATLLATTACQQKMDISDQELIREMEDCMANENKSPGMAVACGNYEAECRRRGKETGNYICGG